MVNKSLICAIQQPTFFPWMGYFDMISSVDTFVFLDNVQLVKRGWWVRNKVKNENGELYLTIPIKKTAHRNNLLGNEAVIDHESRFRDKHLKSIYYAYKRSIYFNEVFPFIESCYTNQKVLSEFNIFIINAICTKIGITTKTVKSSDLKKISGQKDRLLVSICEELGIKKYLSAEGSKEYIEKNNPGGAFSKNGIDLYYRQYNFPHYNQLFGKFISHLSIIDLLFNVGFNKSLEMIRSGNRKPVYYKNLYKK